MPEQTLDAYLDAGAIEWRLRFIERADGGWDAYMHPADRSGPTLDVTLTDDALVFRTDGAAAGSPLTK